MWVRKRIDISWFDLLSGILRSCWPQRRDDIRQRIEDDWSTSGDGFVCLSVRTGFDLLLDALDLPPNSEILMSAVTIGDMVRIVQQHDLVAVPVDLDMSRLAPTRGSMRRAVTPATRAIVVAHLFGSRVPMEPILAFANEHGLLVIEDCAQAFCGSDYRGHPSSDVSMYSFGPIKTATALGGALLRVRDAQLLDRMRAKYATYPFQSRAEYMRRLLKYGMVKLLSTRWLLGGIACACRLIGRDHDRLSNRLARSFAGPKFLARIRRQPSTGLLSLLERRLNTFDDRDLQRRISGGKLLVELLDGIVALPGANATDPTYWVFPVVVREPQAFLRDLWCAGFDATQGESQCVVPATAVATLDPSANGDRVLVAAVQAQRVIERTVFLPFASRMPPAEIRRMASVVRRHCRVDPPVAFGISKRELEYSGK